MTFDPRAYEGDAIAPSPRFIIDPSRNVHHRLRRNFMSSKVKYLRILALMAVLALIIGTVRSSYAQDGDTPDGASRPERGSQPVTFPNLHIPHQGLTGQVTLLVQFTGRPAANVYSDAISSGMKPDAATSNA